MNNLCKNCNQIKTYLRISRTGKPYLNCKFCARERVKAFQKNYLPNMTMKELNQLIDTGTCGKGDRLLMPVTDGNSYSSKKEVSY
jgi:molybdenum cofactor biosynthesis enzyme MoaA